MKETNSHQQNYLLISHEYLRNWISSLEPEGSSESQRNDLRSRCSDDIYAFSLFFFEHHLGRAFGSFHDDIISFYRESSFAGPLNKRPGRRLAIAAPRGAAKTTFKTLILPIHSVLYQRERYIAILSATLKQARRRLRNIKAEIQKNSKLQAFYPQLTSQPESWNANSITINGVQIDVYSAGTEIRGISHNQWRPTLIILDDIEDNRSAYSPGRRQMLLEWYNDVIENIGDTYTAVEVIGTLLHPDSLLNNLLQRPDFQSRTYRSVERFADREDLWAEWRALYTNLSNPNRIVEARAFYETNKHALLQGTKVLWEAKEDYYTLMTQLTNMGRAAFFKEKQNQPTLAGESFFDLSRITRFHLNDDQTITILPPGENSSQISNSQISNPFSSIPSYSQPETQNPKLKTSSLIIAGFLDPSTGKPSRSENGTTPTTDYAAIVTVGIDPAGYIYILDAWIQQAAPTAQISQIFNLGNLWKYNIFGIEANAFQHLFLAPIEEERAKRRDTKLPWQVPTREVNHTQNKNLRIATLEPLISNGWIRFRDNLPQLFWNQLESFPRARHDDAPDALEGAVALARSLQVPIPRQSSPRRVTPVPLRNY